MNMEYVKELLVLLIGSSLVSNVVLSQFLGLCPFLGVSRKTNTAAGMGAAVIFVITLASAVAGVIYEFVLVRFHVEYLKTIVFILVNHLFPFLTVHENKQRRSRCSFLRFILSIVLAALISHSARSLTCRLTRCLALATPTFFYGVL